MDISSGSDYEKLAAEIASGIMGKASNIADDYDLRSGHSCCIEGASGHLHQIDVAIEIQKKLYIIECKCWNKKVPIDQMLVFLGRVVDIRDHSDKDIIPIFVTTKGYDLGAQLIASKYGITTHIVKDANEFAIEIAGNLAVGRCGVNAETRIGRVTVITDNT